MKKNKRIKALESEVEELKGELRVLRLEIRELERPKIYPLPQPYQPVSPTVPGPGWPPPPVICDTNTGRWPLLGQDCLLT